MAGVVALILAFVLLSGGGDDGDDKASKADREVLLESAASAGPSPFTPSLQPVSVTSPTTAATATTVPPATNAPSGRAAQGPFGGTGDNTLCDRELLVEFLTDPANAGAAREWARVLDIRVSEIPTYVRALIPTTLNADARVTNHRWENGRAVGYQAVLERGTAVLVDTKGRLVARCRCGNPLLAPQEVAGPVYVGPRWAGFDPQVIVVVVPSPTPIYSPGGGAIPPTTTSTRASTTTTTRRSAAEATRRIKELFEACARTDLPSNGFFTPAELEAVLAGLAYTATAVDERSGIYRVVLTAADSNVSAGSVTGGTATWEINLTTGEITPIDANAMETATSCATLA